MRQGIFSINRICKLCGISKNTFYNHKHPDERFETKYRHLKVKINKLIKENSSYGIKRIKAALLGKYQIRIGRDALGRLLKLWGLQMRRKNKRSKISLLRKILISLADRANLLIRKVIDKPFQAITSDISELWYNNGKNKAYFCVHKDVFGQIAYGWELSDKMDAQLVLWSFDKALKRIKYLAKEIPKKMLCHQDQGSQYTSYEYVDEVLKSGLILSYSTPGTPTDNPGQESFFGRFKEENQDELNEIREFKQLRKFIKNKMKYYDGERIHTSIGYQSPEQFTKQFIKSVSLSKPKQRFTFSRT